jgi:transcription elongation factor Elf1
MILHPKALSLKEIFLKKQWIKLNYIVCLLSYQQNKRLFETSNSVDIYSEFVDISRELVKFEK